MITSDDDSGEGMGSRIIFSPESSGIFYLEASAYADQFTGKYSISAYENTIQPEPEDDHGATPDGSGSIAIESSIEGDLEAVGDLDWFKVELEADKSYSFDLVGITLDDPFLILRDANGSMITSDDDSGEGMGSRIIFSPESSGIFYLEASAYADQFTGKYSISAYENTIKPEPEPEPEDDHGATPDRSGSIAIGSSIEGDLEAAGDLDWFKVELEADKSYSFDLVGITLDDPFLILRDANGSMITNDDDSGEGMGSRIIFSPESSGNFYLEASSYADQFTGQYLISAEEAPPLPAGYSPENGYGHVSIKRSFEKLLGSSLDDAVELGGNLWGLDNIEAPEVWADSRNFSGVTGSGAIIAVVDTGVDLDHPEFEGRITQGFDFVDNDNIADDGEGHGTHVAGTIAGENDGKGITGVAPDASIMPIRVLDDEGYGYTSDIIAGIRWAANNGADVINLSLGGGSFSQAMADAVAYASDMGSVVVMAAGNDAGRSPIYPAAHAETHGIAVGAVDQEKSLAGFSNRSGYTSLDYVTAPGVDIFSSIPNGNYDYYSGTSMAAPHVAGIAALLKSYDKSLTAEEIENLVTITAENNFASELSDVQPDELTGQSASDIITAETLHKFEESQLQTRLIGSLSGNLKTRKSFLREIREHESEDEFFEDFDVVRSTDRNLVTLDLSGSDRQNNTDLLKNLLSQNHFDYFEVDTQMRMI